MKLEYRILWVEDEVDYIDAFPFSRIENHIRECGFEPSLIVRSSPEDVRKVVNKNEFDLLVVDFRITNDDYHGSDLIQEIRKNNCLTEVVFYSGDGVSALHEESGKKGLEGIYFGPKDNDSLIRKITDVFDLTVRKILDVNNMRGFVMAGVAELDLLLEEIITLKHEKLSLNDQKSLRRKMVEKILPESKFLSVLAHELPDEKREMLTAALAGVREHEPASFEVLFGRRMDSSKRVDTVIGFCKSHQYLTNYETDISNIRPLLHWRNALAHQRPVEHEGGGLQFNVEKKKIEFDDAQTLELRKQIRLYIEKLTAVLEAIREFQPTNM
jgi:hypothetical protein